jgi:hypothetical protein
LPKITGPRVRQQSASTRRNAAILPDIGQVRVFFAIVLLVGSGCGIAAGDEVPLPRSRPVLFAEPKTFAEANPGLFDPKDLTTEPSDCRLRLSKLAAIEPMPRLIGPGACGGSDMVRLDAAILADGTHISFHPAPVLRCTMAESLAGWVRDEAAPRAATLGSPLSGIENYDDFECRGRNRVIGAKLSEHGKGNALDVRAFKLADGRTIMPTDMTVAKDFREGLRESVCERFTTVLGPGSDGYHESHIHLDVAERSKGYRICQWDVREPPPTEVASAKVPLPQPRPVIPRDPVADRKL